MENQRIHLDLCSFKVVYDVGDFPRNINEKTNSDVLEV